MKMLVRNKELVDVARTRDEWIGLLQDAKTLR